MPDTLAGRLTENGHRLQVRVYYEDTDFSGVVYHARYLHFLERGRTDYLRLLGVHHRDLAAGKAGEALAFAVRRMEIDFRKAAGIDDILTVETRPAELSGARLALVQLIERDGETICQANVEIVVMNGQGRVRRIPQIVRELLSQGSSEAI